MVVFQQELLRNLAVYNRGGDGCGGGHSGRTAFVSEHRVGVQCEEDVAGLEFRKEAGGL